MTGKETAIAHLAKIHPIGKEQFLKEIRKKNSYYRGC